jgi:hypothetical protein
MDSFRFASFLAIISFVSLMRLSMGDSISAASQAPTDVQTEGDDDEDDWIFDSGLYTESPETGQRVWQYAKEKPAYRSAPSNYLPLPYHYTFDPFFSDSTDVFFMDNPDPFFASPGYYPFFSSGPLNSNGYFYGINTEGYNPE